jgi:hypothetical protein
MDDSKTVVFSKPATSSIEGWLARGVPELLARCQEGETDVYVALGMPMAVESGDTRTVEVRVDGSAARTEYWNESTNGKSLFSPDAIGFARELSKATRLRLRVTPFNSSPVIVEFNLAGFARAAKELETVCEWPSAAVTESVRSGFSAPSQNDHRDSPNKEEEVYISDESTIYHRKDCVSLSGKRNVHSVKLGSLGPEFDACGTCHPPK